MVFAAQSPDGICKGFRYALRASLEEVCIRRDEISGTATCIHHALGH
jgi:hypothetical protein